MAYRELLTLIGEVEAGEDFVLDHTDNGDAHFSFIDDDRNIVLYVGVARSEQKIKITRYDHAAPGPRWTRLGEIDFARLCSDALKIAVTYGAPTRVTLNGGCAVDVDVDFRRITKLVGDGEWSGVRRTGPRDSGFHDSLIVKNIGGIDASKPTYRPEMIMDIGMHDAKDTVFYLKKGFTVVAVEANPELARMAATRLSDEIKAGRLTIVNNGIFETDGTQRFYINHSNTEWSSFIPHVGKRVTDAREVMVSTMSPARLFAKFGVPYFVKIDIEGADTFVLREIAALAEKPRFLSFETSGESCMEEVRRLHAAGYQRFAVVNQAVIPDVVLPPVQREGRAVDHRFRWGASGPFGDDLGDTWETADAAVERLTEVWRRKRAGEGVGWYDVHARLD